MFGCWLHNNTSFVTLMQIFRRQAPDKKIMLMFRSWSSNEITGLFKHPQLPFHNFYEADSYWGFNLDLVCLELIVSTPNGPQPPDLIIVITTLLPRPGHWPPNIFSHETCSHIWDQRREAGGGAGGEIGSQHITTITRSSTDTLPRHWHWALEMGLEQTASLQLLRE